MCELDMTYIMIKQQQVAKIVAKVLFKGPYVISSIHYIFWPSK